MIQFTEALLYLNSVNDQAKQTIAQKMKAEYPPKSQAQVFEIDEHLKIKEREGPFSKILDDAKGDLSKVKKLADLAENVGREALVENRG